MARDGVRPFTPSAKPPLTLRWSQLDTADFTTHQVASKARERTHSEYVYLQRLLSTRALFSDISLVPQASGLGTFLKSEKTIHFAYTINVHWTTRWIIKYSSSTTTYAPRLSRRLTF